MLPILASGWPTLLSLLIVFMVIFGLMMEIYSVFTKSNPNLWIGVPVIAGLSLIGTSAIWVWGEVILTYLSAFIVGTYSYQGYLFLGGIFALLLMISIDTVYSWFRDWFEDSGEGKFTTTWNLFLSVGSVSIVLILLFAPGVLAEGLEKVETAQSGVISTSELITDSTLSYEPYLELNEDTKGVYDTTDCALVFADGDYRQIDIMEFNVTDHYDNIGYTPGGTINQLVIYMFVDAEDMMEKSINTLTFQGDLGSPYAISRLLFRTLDGGYIKTGEHEIDISNIDELETNHYSLHISESDLINIASLQFSESQPYNVLVLMLDITEYTGGFNVLIDYQLQPEYYVLYDNSTYEPFIQTYSNPYVIGMWTFGIGGILLMIISPCVLPWVRIMPWIKEGMGL